MTKLKFLGAAGTVTGSSFLLTPENGQAMLVDMGMFQGPPETSDLNYLPLAFNPKIVGGVVITHAHLDHVGRLPILIKEGYRGPIYVTEPTRILAEITLLDSARIALEDESKLPMYSEEDVFKTLTLMEIVNYHQEFQISQFKIKLLDAGHILGSTSVVVTDTQSKSVKTIVFSGDLGNTPEDIVKPTEVPPFADVVLMESTYGDRTHADENPDVVLAEEIEAIEKDKATLLIPAFSLERAQELLHKIDHLKRNLKVREDTLVFLDSPMAIKATNVYKHFKNLYGKEMSQHAAKDDPFDFPGLQLVETGSQSKRIKDIPGAKVIIAGSGMMTGGRILHHAKYFLPDSRNRLLIVGFQGEKTTGREIIDGTREIMIDGEKVVVAANVRKSSGMSAHADQPKLINWINGISNTKKVYLIHGENTSREALSQLIKDRVGIKEVYMPQITEEVELN